MPSVQRGKARSSETARGLGGRRAEGEGSFSGLVTPRWVRGQGPAQVDRAVGDSVGDGGATEEKQG